MLPQLITRNRFCTLFTGTGSERVQGVSIMNDGRVLVTGETTSPDFAAQFGVPTPMPYDTIHNGNADFYVAILDAQLSNVERWTYFGGSGDDRAYFAKQDVDGKIWVCGLASSSNFPSGSDYSYTVGANSGGFDVLVARLSEKLDQLEVTVRVQGSANENPRGTLWIDNSVGNNAVYVSGGTFSQDFPSVLPNSQTTPPDSTTGSTFNFCPVSGACATHCESGPRGDAFVIKIDRILGTPLWVRVLGGNEDDNAWGNVRVDPVSHDVYIGGCSRSPFSGINGLIDTSYDSITAPNYGARSGPADGYVAKLDKDDGRVIALAYIGGSGTDWVAFNDCLELDSQGRPVVAGLTRSTDLPIPTTCQPLNANHSQASPDDCDFESNDVFVAKFSTDLGTLVYATYVNQTPGLSAKADKREECAGLAIYHDYVLLTGETDSPGFPITRDNAFDNQISTAHTEYTSCPPLSCPPPVDFHDAFLIRFWPGISTASTLQYGTFFGGNLAVAGATESGNRGRSLSVFPGTHAYAGWALFSGMTTASDFGLLTTPGAEQPAWLPGDQRAGFVGVHEVY